MAILNAQTNASRIEISDLLMSDVGMQAWTRRKQNNPESYTLSRKLQEYTLTRNALTAEQLRRIELSREGTGMEFISIQDAIAAGTATGYADSATASQAQNFRGFQPSFSDRLREPVEIKFSEVYGYTGDPTNGLSAEQFSSVFQDLLTKKLAQALFGLGERVEAYHQAQIKAEVWTLSNATAFAAFNSSVDSPSVVGDAVLVPAADFKNILTQMYNDSKLNDYNSQFGRPIVLHNYQTAGTVQREIQAQGAGNTSDLAQYMDLLEFVPLKEMTTPAGYKGEFLLIDPTAMVCYQKEIDRNKIFVGDFVQDGGVMGFQMNAGGIGGKYHFTGFEVGAGTALMPELPNMKIDFEYSTDVVNSVGGAPSFSNDPDVRDIVFRGFLTTRPGFSVAPSQVAGVKPILQYLSPTA